MNMQRKQSGAVLIVTLMLLIVMTVLGLSSMNNSIMEEKMAGNLRNSNMSFMAAESGLRVAEQSIVDLSSKPVPSEDGSSGIWLLDYPDANFDASVDEAPSEFWWLANAQSWWANDADAGTGTDSNTLYHLGDDNALGGTGADADKTLTSHYVVEYLQPVCDTMNVGQQSDQQSCEEYYQITALGLGAGSGSRTYLRSTIKRRF